MHADRDSVYGQYTVLCADRAAAQAALQAAGIPSAVHYPRPLHLQPCFRDLGYSAGDFPVAERACGRTVALPLYPDLAVEDLDYVCDVIAAFYEGDGR